MGTHWTRAGMKPELQVRAICQKCGVVEDLDHTLTKCESSGQEMIWEMAGELWSKKKTNIPWRAPTIRDIIGCGLARIYGDGTEKILQGKNWTDYWIDGVLVGTTGRDGNGGVG
ncbi:hypothetical protein J3R30DRAFT_3578941 [Lentinula aciculospora]|uniref:Reverse transcriptase zinc-binding domain-containing protein n=1 Tax=Lentinula aciculospora TaxID=153920 RepID=A0A9W9DF11_9AGAR|nr:hypothetical protein J3R30DRAFT_3578941 [Lentinula aciculospora]